MPCSFLAFLFGGPRGRRVLRVGTEPPYEQTGAHVENSGPAQEVIEKQLGPAVATQRLIFTGRVLDNAKTLNE